MRFNDIEERVLRYLEHRFVKGGGFGSATPDEIAKANGLQPDQYTRLIARFESLGILEEVTLDGLISIKGKICSVVAELDQSDPSTASGGPNRQRDECRQHIARFDSTRHRGQQPNDLGHGCSTSEVSDMLRGGQWSCSQLPPMSNVMPCCRRSPLTTRP